MRKLPRRLFFSFGWLALTFLFITFFLSPVFSLSEEECRQVQEEDLGSGIQCWQDLLAETSSRKKTLESEVVKFDSRIALTSARISQSLTQIGALEKEIVRLGSRIKHLDLSLDEISKLLIERVRETYKRQKADPVFLLFSSQSFAQFVSRYEYFKIAQLHDRKLLFQMEEARVNYHQEKELKEEKQLEVERLKDLLEKEKTVLSQQKKEKEHLFKITESNEKNYQRLLASARAEKEAIEKAMAQGLALLKDGSAIKKGETVALMGNTGAPCCSTGTHLHFEIRAEGVAQDPAVYLKPQEVVWDNYPDGSFSFSGSWDWPMANPRITQGFGMTYYAGIGYYGGDPHTGLDMVGSPSAITAPGDGTLYRGTTNCCRNGNSCCGISYVAIDHGGGLVSWYWHVQ